MPTPESAPKGAAPTKQSLSVTDNRTGKQYELPIEHGAIKAMDIRNIKTDPEDFGLMSYDPAYLKKTASRAPSTRRG